MTTFLVYLYLVVFILFDLFLFVLGFEIFITNIKGRAPEIPSTIKQRMAVVKQIHKFAPNAKTIIDIGSGWGTMVRTVAKKNKHAKVIGVEIMPLPYIYSLIRSVFVRNAKFVRADAFKYINKDNKKFDVGITYLLTPEMRNVQKVLSHFDVLISVDFPLPDVKPTQKIKIHRDFLAQHWLYVYKNN